MIFGKLPRRLLAVRPRFGSAEFSIFILVLALLICIGFLIREKRENAALTGTVALLRHAMAPPETVQVGDILPPIEVVSLTGEDKIVACNDSERCLLLFLSAGCEICESDIPIWNDLAVTLRNKGWKVSAVFLEPIDQVKIFLVNKETRFDVYSHKKTDFKKIYKVNAVPQTIVLSQGGKVDRVSLGFFSENDKMMIEHLSLNDRGQ